MANPGLNTLLVGVGGFAGSLARYGLSLLSQRWDIAWPIGTLGANVAGCLAIGIITEAATRGSSVSPEARLLLATGFCGGFTTMSSLIYETAQMFRAGEYGHGTLYAAGSFALSMLAFMLGVVAVRVLMRMGGGLWS